MLYWLIIKFIPDVSWLNVFKYITFRTGISIFTSLFFALIIGPYVIKKFISLQNGGQPIRDDGPASHLQTKKGTPTMGGFIILASFVFSLILWADLANLFVWSTIIVTLGFGMLGFYDDYLKVTKRNTKGISGKKKLLFQTLIAVIAYFMITYASSPELRNILTFPFLKNFFIDLGVFYLIFTVIVIIGASNAVNLTDGLDGLAIGPVIIATCCFALIIYLAGNINFAQYLQIPHIQNIAEVCVLCGAIIGASLGFLWYNAPPARIFMGDTGSLALGGMIGTLSVISKHEIVLAIIGGLFVMEAVSVILQVYYFKITGGKRIFKMAPLHHHFEKCGWSETTIVIRFWIIAFIFALLGLATLKLR